MKNKEYKASLFSLPGGARISGLTDYPLSIYRIVDSFDIGTGIELSAHGYTGESGNPVILMNEKSGRLRSVSGNTIALVLDPRDQWEAEKQQQTQNRQEQKTMNKKFDFDTEDAKQIAVNVFKTTGGTIARLKAGKAVLTTIKSSIREIPGLPIAVLALLETPYADAVIGIILGAIVPLVTDSKIAVKASVAANLAGTVAISEKITFLEDWIEKGVAFIPAKVVELLEDDDSSEVEQPKE